MSKRIVRRIVRKKPQEGNTAPEVNEAEKEEAAPVDPLLALADVGEELEKGFSLFGLAWKNVFTYTWMNLKICFTFCLFTVYNAAINEREEAFTRGSASANLIITQSSKTLDFFHEELKTFALEDVYYGRSYNTLISERYGVGGKYSGDTSFYTLEVDGKAYNASKVINFTSIVHPEDKYFTEADRIELKENFGKDSFFSMGHYPATPEEIAVSPIMLEAYGLEGKDVMGKMLTVYLKDPREGYDPLYKLYSYTVCGIIDEDVYSLTGHASNTNTRPVVLFQHENEHAGGSHFVRYRLYLKDWPDADKMIEWREHFAGVDESYSYLGFGYVQKANALARIQILATNLYIIVGAALIVGLVLTIFLMIDKYMKVFSRSSGILMTLGLRRSQLYLMLGMQLFILCVLAVPVAFLLTAGGYYVINLLVKWVTNVALGISIGKLISMLLAGIATVIALSLIFFVYALFKFRVKTIKDYLTTEVD